MSVCVKQFSNHHELVNKTLKYGILLRQFQLPRRMRCVELNKYGMTIDELEPEKTTLCPSERDIAPNEALIKISAASINPFDIEMTRGYGRNAINVFRKFSNRSEFPLILGRDCSGTVIKRGKCFRRFKVGDSVCCIRWIDGQGTHAEYVVAKKTEISSKPNNMSHIEAACFPYVACTTWNALISSGAVPTVGRPKKIFIPGGTGGVGSFAVQLCQNFGHDVITSCATDGIKLLNTIGINNAIDYKSTTFESDLQSCGPFDVIYDTLNERHFEVFNKLLKSNPSSKYVSLRPTLLPEMDKRGVALGLLTSSSKYLQSNFSQIASGQGSYSWGFFTANALILDRIKPLIECGKIKPLIDKVFSLDDALNAYKYVESGHARGKTIINME